MTEQTSSRGSHFSYLTGWDRAVETYHTSTEFAHRPATEYSKLGSANAAAVCKILVDAVVTTLRDRKAGDIGREVEAAARRRQSK